MIQAEKLPWVMALKDVASPRRRLMDTFRLFVALVACEVAHPLRTHETPELVRGWDRDEYRHFPQVFGQLVLDMDARPYQDVIGPAYEVFEGKGNKRATGSFYTPGEVARLIARLGMDGLRWPRRGPLTVHEPACGSGAMLLAQVEACRQLGAPPQSVRIHAWDISRLACDMAFINLSLYGVPAEVTWGDTLRLEVSGRWRTLWYHAAHGWNGEAA